MAYSYYFASRHERSLGEVLLASQRFAYARGTETGWFVVPLLMLLPPVTNKLVDLAITMSSGANDSINAIENGRFDPSLPLAFRIADVFGLSVEEVFDKTDV